MAVSLAHGGEEGAAEGTMLGGSGQPTLKLARCDYFYWKNVWCFGKNRIFGVFLCLMMYFYWTKKRFGTFGIGPIFHKSSSPWVQHISTGLTRLLIIARIYRPLKITEHHGIQMKCFLRGVHPSLVTWMNPHEFTWIHMNSPSGWIRMYIIWLDVPRAKHVPDWISGDVSGAFTGSNGPEKSVKNNRKRTSTHQTDLSSDGQTACHFHRGPELVSTKTPAELLAMRLAKTSLRD